MADIEMITLAQAVETIKTAILQSQARAARSVSANQLALYFSVGGYISLNTRQQQWGSGAIKAISERLQKELPGLQGFSAESINKMRRFYEEWSAIVFQSPLATNIENVIHKSEVDEKIVEQEIIHNVKNFIMMFGHDFTFVGNQYHLEKFGDHPLPRSKQSLCGVRNPKIR